MNPRHLSSLLCLCNHNRLSSDIQFSGLEHQHPDPSTWSQNLPHKQFALCYLPFCSDPTVPVCIPSNTVTEKKHSPDVSRVALVDISFTSVSPPGTGTHSFKPKQFFWQSCYLSACCSRSPAVGQRCSPLCCYGEGGGMQVQQRKHSYFLNDCLCSLAMPP